MTFQDGAIIMNRATEANATTFDIQTFQNTWKSRLNLIEDSLRSCSSTDFQSFAMNKDRYAHSGMDMEPETKAISKGNTLHSHG